MDPPARDRGRPDQRFPPIDRSSVGWTDEDIAGEDDRLLGRQNETRNSSTSPEAVKRNNQGTDLKVDALAR
jgi:hypothetical protein